MSSLLLALHIACLLGSIAYLDGHVRSRVVGLLRALGQTTIDRVADLRRLLASSPTTATPAELESFVPPRETAERMEKALHDPATAAAGVASGTGDASAGGVVDEEARPPPEDIDAAESAEEPEELIAEADVDSEDEDVSEVGEFAELQQSHPGGLVAINPADYSQTRRPSDEGFRVENTQVLREVYVSPRYVREVSDVFVESELALYALQFSLENAARLIRCTVLQSQKLPLTLSKPLRTADAVYFYVHLYREREDEEMLSTRLTVESFFENTLGPLSLDNHVAVRAAFRFLSPYTTGDVLTNLRRVDHLSPLTLLLEGPPGEEVVVER